MHSYIFIQENAFEYVVWKMAAILSLPQCVKCTLRMKKKQEANVGEYSDDKHEGEYC